MPTGYDRNIFLSTLPASRRDRATACSVVGVSAVLFACAVPFANTPLTPLPAFVASYQSALAINDLITTVLLLSQLSVQRSRPAVAGVRVSVHRRRRHSARPHLPRTSRTVGIARRWTADDGLALHVLARRLSAMRPRLCAVEAAGGR